jgi:hypothetical protein
MSGLGGLLSSRLDVLLDEPCCEGIRLRDVSSWDALKEIFIVLWLIVNGQDMC